MVTLVSLVAVSFYSKPFLEPPESAPLTLSNPTEPKERHENF